MVELNELKGNSLTFEPTPGAIEALEADDYLVVDLETDGLLEDYSRIWVACVYDPQSATVTSYHGKRLEELPAVLKNRYLVMHNGLKFDWVVLERFWPGAVYPSQVIDTLVLSRLGRPDRKGGHALQAWGLRVGTTKVEHDDWTQLSPEMIERCEFDTLITEKVFQKLFGMLKVMPLAVAIEHSVAFQTGVVERTGFGIDVPKAEALYQRLSIEYQETLAELQKAWPARLVQAGKSRALTTVNRRHPLHGLLEPDTEYTPLKNEEFTGSRQQAASRLRAQYGWVPSAWTETGEPVINRDTLGSLEFPEAKLLLNLYELEKMLGYLKSRADRKKKSGWLDLERKGRVHCSLNYNGAYTHRMACSSPNLQQVSSDGPMREVWVPAKGWTLVGVDAASLELRLLAHYVAKYDKGAWAKEVVSGDAHTANQNAMGLWCRDTAKRIIYAYPYGAGDGKLGTLWLVEDKETWRTTCAKFGKTPEDWHPRWDVLGIPPNSTRKDIGAAIKRLPLFGAVEKVKRAGRACLVAQGWVPGLDGRRVWSDPDHSYSIIATLCQSAGAIVMKAAIYLCPRVFEAYGLREGIDYRFVMYVHDEFQIEAQPDKVELVEAAGKDAIRLAGDLLKLRVPMAGDAKHGQSWKETH